MKRRKFLKTVGGAAGAAALGACAKGSSKAAPTPQGQTPQGQTVTYQMGGIDTNSPPPTHFSKRTRKVGWWPDAADWSGQNSKDRLFQEESFGMAKDAVGNDLLVPFGVDFKPANEDSKKWVLGKKLAKPTDPKVDVNFTLFVRRLARLARQYNASLYRLRRLRFYSKYPNIANNPSQVKWPKDSDKWGNSPWGSKPGKPDPVNDVNGFHQMASDAETDWQRVTNNFDQYLNDIENTGKSSLFADTPFSFRLKAYDVVTVNGYLMSMRVLVDKPDSQGRQSREVGGSSSHVSLSSAFSSHSP